MKIRAVLLASVMMLAPVGLAAQDAQTLADIRQELTVLNTELQKLQREMSTTGNSSGAVISGSTLDRVAAIESELQRLTSKTEELEFRIGRIVKDGTNRIGDLEFRLTELEGGDLGNLGETPTLGGGDAPAAPATATNTAQTQLAVGEEADFKRASEALASGDFRGAADKFATFNQTYPGSPLAVQVDLRRGQALSGIGDTREAARAFLAAFSAEPTGDFASDALFELGRSLGRLGQANEACVTLSEVSIRFPNTPAASSAEGERANIGCS